MADSEYLAGQMTALAIQSESQLRSMLYLCQALDVDPQIEKQIENWNHFLSKTKEEQRLSAPFREGFEHIAERILKVLSEKL